MPAAGGTSCRSSSDGLTCRTSSSGTSENRIETSRPIAKPWATAAAVSPNCTFITAVRSPTNDGTAAMTAAASATPRALPASAEQQHLRHVDGEHLRRRGADALQDRDAPHLLLHEHARHARDADAAENQDDQADEAQVVLGAREVLAHLVFRAPVPADADELVRERVAQVVRPAPRRRPPARAAAAGTTRGCRTPASPVESRSARSIITRGPSVNAPMRRPGSAVMTPRISNGSVPIRMLIADFEAELRQQLRAHERAVPFEQRVGIGAVAQRQRAVQRELRPDRAQLHHPRCQLRGIGRPHHRRDLGRLGAHGDRGRRALPRRASSGPRRVHGRLVVSITSAPSSVRASPASATRTLWMTDRSATIEPTPMAMQTKKNSSRCHDARISRIAMRRTKVIAAPPPACPPAGRRAATSRASASAASSASCVTSTSVGLPRAVHVEQQLHDVPAGRGIEVAGRLVGQHDRRIVGERARDRHALLFAARELRRVVMAAIRQPHFLEQLPRPRRPRRAAWRFPSARGCSRTRSATARGERTGRRSRSSRRAASPARLRRACVMSVPSIRISPVLGASSPASSPSSVDLPLPDGPTTATNRPDGIERSSGCRIVSGRPPLSTVLDTPRSSIIDPCRAPARAPARSSRR